MCCDLSTASEVFLIFTTQLYQYLSVFFLFALFSDDPEVFPSQYSQTTILHASHFLRVVNQRCSRGFTVLPDLSTSCKHHNLLGECALPYHNVLSAEPGVCDWRCTIHRPITSRVDTESGHRDRRICPSTYGHSAETLINHGSQTEQTEWTQTYQALSWPVTEDYFESTSLFGD